MDLLINPKWKPMQDEPKKGPFSVTQDELKALFRIYPNPNAITEKCLLAVGIFLTPITLAGALWGYVRGYKRFMQYRKMQPTFVGMLPIVRVAMILGAILIWAFLFLILKLAIMLWVQFFSERDLGLMGVYLLVNASITFTVMLVFRRWRSGILSVEAHRDKFGSAEFATSLDMEEFAIPNGHFIGGHYAFDDNGHFLTVAGTRGGKGTNLIVPNLLGKRHYKTSWVVIDPKGENAAITARYQRQSGQKVVVLNPWDLLADKIGESECYNPLDLLSDTSNIHFVDDVAILAEMIVPEGTDDKDRFFSDNARSIITGLLMHLMTHDRQSVTDDNYPNGERELVAVKKVDNYERTADDIILFPEKTLTTLWQWVRLSGDRWDKLVAQMKSNSNPHCGLAVRTAAEEIEKLMLSGDETYGSIFGVVLQSTAFLNSPSLQASLSSQFDPYKLADGNTTLYIVIPVDKLKSHARWLRLVITSMMRAVVRKPDRKVTFVLDEFAALGYISEIEVALSTYAGYGVSLWIVLQSLIQLQKLYDKGWEIFVANTVVKQYFNINDNFTAEYVSHAIGSTSNVIVKRSWLSVEEVESNARPLITPDELHRESGTMIFLFVKDKPAAMVPKIPYYEMEIMKDRADPNPYYKEKKGSKGYEPKQKKAVPSLLLDEIPQPYPQAN